MRLHSEVKSPSVPLSERGKMQLLPFEKGGREGFVYVARPPEADSPAQ